MDKTIKENSESNVSSELKNNFIVYPETKNYLENLHYSLIPDERLVEFEKYAVTKNMPIIQRDVAFFLFQMIKIHHPKNILELGTNIGYSSAWMALASPNSFIDTIEFKQENVLEAKKNLKKFSVHKQIKVHHSPALDFLQRMEKKYDFVFIDVNKKENDKYLEILENKLPIGAIIIIDNLLWKGRTTAKSLIKPDHMESTYQIRKFNRNLVENKNFVSQILPIGDGISLSFKIN
jgi:predicted O-methyltransferase YrrM